jgi:hypothetical protein
VRQSSLVPSRLGTDVAKEAKHHMGGYPGTLDYLGQQKYLHQAQVSSGGRREGGRTTPTFSCSAHGASRAGSMACLAAGTRGKTSTKVVARIPARMQPDKLSNERSQGRKVSADARAKRPLARGWGSTRKVTNESRETKGLTSGRRRASRRPAADVNAHANWQRVVSWDWP